jgi:hypothetical protein
MPAMPRRITARALVALAGIVVAGSLVACTPEPADAPSPIRGLLTLTADRDGEASLGLWASSPGATDGVAVSEIPLPSPATAWISVGRASVLAATLLDGTVQVSGPVDPGATDEELAQIDWRAIEASDPTGDPFEGPAWFATWEPRGGAYAAIVGDLPAGEDVRLALVDPTAAESRELDLDTPLLAAPPVWVGTDVVALVAGATTEPTSLIVDTDDGAVGEGPVGARRLAASIDTTVIATTAGEGSGVEIGTTEAWLDGSGASVATIDAPDADTTAISLALDRTGSRLAIVWLDGEGGVRLAVHDGADGWRRVLDQPLDGVAAAAVAWLR